MDVNLHIGAHRTGTTSFQHYMRAHRVDLQALEVAYWGPARTRKGMFEGVLARKGPDMPRLTARRRIGSHVRRLGAAGHKQLIVSDENMMGSVRKNLTQADLYRDVGKRLTRFNHAFGGRVTRVVLQVRALDGYWTSALGYALRRSVPVETQDLATRILSDARTWRAVIGDVAQALPGAQLLVTDFRDFVKSPQALAQVLCNHTVFAPDSGVEIWRNRSHDKAALRSRGDDLPPDIWDENGQLMLFNKAQGAQLRERYDADMEWLRSGADGLAELVAPTPSDDKRIKR